MTGAYGSESVWNDTDLLGGLAEGGSGVSNYYSRPAYQTPVIGGAKMRVVPDVSYNAAVLQGVLVRWEGATYRFGGTSAGSPQWAALTAIADQIAGHRISGINKTLYSLGQASQGPASTTRRLGTTASSTSGRERGRRSSATPPRPGSTSRRAGARRSRTRWCRSSQASNEQGAAA